MLTRSQRRTRVGRSFWTFLSRRVMLAPRRGPQLWNDAAVAFVQASRISSGVYNVTSPDGTYAAVAVNGVLTIGRRYEVMFTVDIVTVPGTGLQVESTQAPSVTTVGAKRFIVTAATASALLKRAGTACNYQISKISFRSWTP